MFNGFKLLPAYTLPGKELMRVYLDRLRIARSLNSRRYQNLRARVVVGGSLPWQCINQFVHRTAIFEGTDIDSYFVGENVESQAWINHNPADIGAFTVAGFSGVLPKGSHEAGFYQWKYLGNDYAIGNWETFSNFQVGIDVFTNEIIYDSRFPDHQKAFERFIYAHEIITYYLPELFAQAKEQHSNQDEFNIPLKKLAYIFKSYVKPLACGKTFSLETAYTLKGLLEGTENWLLIDKLAERMSSHYPALFASKNVAQGYFQTILNKVNFIINNTPQAIAQKLLVTQQQAELNEIKAKLKLAEEKASFAEAQVDKLQINHNQTLAEVKTLKKNLFEVSTHLDAKTEKFNITEANLIKKSMEFDTLTKQKNDTQKDLNKQLGDTRSQIGRLQNTNKTLSEKLQSTEAQADNLKNTLQVTQQKLQDETTAKNQLINGNRLLIAQKEEIEKKYATLLASQKIPSVAVKEERSTPPMSPPVANPPPNAISITPSVSKKPRKKHKKKDNHNLQMANQMAAYLKEVMINLGTTKFPNEITAENIQPLNKDFLNYFCDLDPEYFEMHKQFMALFIIRLYNTPIADRAFTLVDAMEILITLEWPFHAAGLPVSAEDYYDRFNIEKNLLIPFLQSNYIQKNVPTNIHTKLCSILKLMTSVFYGEDALIRPEWIVSLNRTDALLSLFESKLNDIMQACALILENKNIDTLRMRFRSFNEIRKQLIQAIPATHSFEVNLAMTIFIQTYECDGNAISANTFTKLLNELNATPKNQSDQNSNNNNKSKQIQNANQNSALIPALAKPETPEFRVWFKQAQSYFYHPREVTEKFGIELIKKTFSSMRTAFPNKEPQLILMEHFKAIQYLGSDHPSKRKIKSDHHFYTCLSMLLNTSFLERLGKQKNVTDKNKMIIESLALAKTHFKQENILGLSNSELSNDLSIVTLLSQILAFYKAQLMNERQPTLIVETIQVLLLNTGSPASQPTHTNNTSLTSYNSNAEIVKLMDTLKIESDLALKH